MILSSLGNSTVSEALFVAKKYYTPETYAHAIRVAEYVEKDNMLNEDSKDACISLALMHDLLEDTEFDASDLDPDLYYALDLLTRKKEVPYDDYCKKIREVAGENEWGFYAYRVKIADMKDHLNQTETLTEKLKAKYLSALRYLL